MLSLRGIDHYYGESHTLWDVDMSVPQGSRMCLMGRNGVGKTTLLKCIMGLEAVSGGVMEFAGTDLRRASRSSRSPRSRFRTAGTRKPE